MNATKRPYRQRGMSWTMFLLIVLGAAIGIVIATPFWLWLSSGFSAWALLPLVTLPYAASTLRDVLTRDRYEDLLPATPKAGRLLLAYSLLLAVGVAFPAA